MAISYVNKGTRNSSSALATVTGAYPASVTSGNLLILLVLTKYGASITVTTPSGWSTFTNNSASAGNGAEGNDSGTVRITLFTKISDGTETGSFTIDLSGTANTAGAQIFQYTKTTGSWAYAAQTGSDTSADTSWSSATTDPGIAANDMLLGWIGVNGNVTLAWSSQAVSQTSATFGTAVERADENSSSGSDWGYMMSEHPVTTAGSGSITYTATADASGTNTPTGPCILMYLREDSGGAPTEQPMNARGQQVPYIRKHLAIGV